MATADIINHTASPILPKISITKDQLEKEFTCIIDNINDIWDKKCIFFEDIYRMAYDKSYNLEDTIIIRHFLLETVEEINNYLIKNHKPCRVNFEDEAYDFFVNENDEYYMENKFYNEDKTLNRDNLNERIKYLDKLVRLCSFSDRLHFSTKGIEIIPGMYELLI